MNRKGKLRMASLTAILLLSIASVISIVPVAMAAYPNCDGDCDICVNGTGWWRADAAFNASNTPIQAAVTGAIARETICVEDGSYTENVNVNTRLTIRAENETYATTVTASSANDHVFEVTTDTDYVNISWFKVEGASTGAGTAGIYLAPNTDHCNISYNNATNNYVGIRLNKSSYNNISFNNASGNDGGSGIGVGKKSNYNTVDNNTVTHNDKNGIGVGILSNYTTIRDNTASNNVDFGIYVNTSSNYTTIRNNTIQDNTDYGVKIRNSHNCNVYYNNFYNNNDSDNNEGLHQAWDNKSNAWDDGTEADNTGNYWDGWTYAPEDGYSIDGDSQVDAKPKEDPF